MLLKDEMCIRDRDDIIVTGGITDEKINDLEESLGLEFRKEIREYLHQYGIIIGYGVETVSYTHLDVYKRQISDIKLVKKAVMLKNGTEYRMQ